MIDSRTQAHGGLNEGIEYRDMSIRMYCTYLWLEELVSLHRAATTWS